MIGIAVISLASSSQKGKDVWSKWPLFREPVLEFCRTNQIASLNSLGGVCVTCRREVCAIKISTHIRIASYFRMVETFTDFVSG